MENIVFLKSTNDPISSPLDSRFLTKNILTGKKSAPFSDCSLSKEILQKKIKKQRMQSLISKHNKAKLDLEKTLNNLNEVNIQYTLCQLKKEKENKLKIRFEILSFFATKIQAAVRGFLTRRKHADLIVFLSRKKFLRMCSSMHTTETQCWLTVGKIVQEAAIKLQRFIKKSLFRLKIQRILYAYNEYLEDQRAPIYYRISRLAGVFVCKEKIKEKKREIYVILKLRRIRERLALISIKKFLKKKKLTVKGIKNKIKRYKRLAKYSKKSSLNRSPTLRENEEKRTQDTPKIITNALSFDLALKYKERPLFQGSSFEKTSSFGLDIDNDCESPLNLGAGYNLTNETSPMSDMQKKDPKKMRDFIINLKQIKNFKHRENNIVPVLCQKEIESRPETHHYSRTSASVYRMIESIPSRSPPIIRRNKRRNLRLKSTKVKSKTPLTFNYLAETTSFKYRTGALESNTGLLTQPEIMLTGKNSIFEPTLSFSHKIREKSCEIQKPSTAPGKSRKLYKNTDPDLGAEKNFSGKEFKIRPRTSNRSCEPVSKNTKTSTGRKRSVHIITAGTCAYLETLSFEAALPEYSEFLTSYLRPLYLRSRPKTGKGMI